MTDKRDFDGHLEYSLRGKSPEEKLEYLTAVLEMKEELTRGLNRGLNQPRPQSPQPQSHQHSPSQPESPSEPPKGQSKTPSG